MIREKYSYQIKKGEFEVKKVYLVEEHGKYLAEFLNDPLETPEAFSYKCVGPYFDTKEEAQAYVDSLIPSDEEINKVTSYLGILPADKFKALKERLDYEVDFNDEEDFDNRMMGVLSEITEPVRLMVNGFLVIHGESIRISEIQAVKWGGDRIYGMEEAMDSCEVILRDGSKKTPTSLQECWLLCVLFGHNFSNRWYTGIHCDFDSKFVQRYDDNDGSKD